MTATPRPVGLLAETAPMAPKAAPARHGATVGATGARPELDPHERVSAAHARLAELHAEIAGIHQELARVQLDDSPESRLMVSVPEASNAPQLLAVSDVAERVKVDSKTIRRWREEGKLPAAVAIGGTVRWEAEAIDRWIAQNREAER